MNWKREFIKKQIVQYPNILKNIWFVNRVTLSHLEHFEDTDPRLLYFSDIQF